MGAFATKEVFWVSGSCFTTEADEVVRWTTMVPHSLHFNGGTCRTGVLARSLPGCSKKMLTQTLREMERDRLIDRKVYPVVPPMVEYSLTPWAGSSSSRSRCFMRGRPRTTTLCRSSGGGGRSTRLRETKRGRFNNPQSRPADQERCQATYIQLGCLQT